MQEEIKNIVEQYKNTAIALDDPQCENMLRFKRNIRMVLGSQVTENEFLYYRGIMKLNDVVCRTNFFNKAFKVWGDIEDSSPCIYVTLHMGCYEYMADFLTQKGIDICIPVTDNVYQQKVPEYKEAFNNQATTQSKLQFVNIETIVGLRQIARYIRNGFSLLCYVDGNSGIGGMNRNDEKLERIHFFNQIIHVRKGIEYLCKRLGLKVIPICTYIEEMSYIPQITIFPPLCANAQTSTTGEIWKTFQRMIWQHFPQWEAWLYIDEFIDSSKESNKDKVYRLNAERYSPLIKERQHFFYDMETNQLIKVTKYLFDILNSLAQMRIESIEDLKKHICKDSLFQDLTEKELIIYK